MHNISAAQETVFLYCSRKDERDEKTESKIITGTDNGRCAGSMHGRLQRIIRKSGETSEASAAGEKSTVTIWATGSDNVRQVYEALIEDFNNNSDYADQYTAKLQFMLSGTGTQSMTDMLAAAYQAKQTDTDYDLVDLGW